MAYFTFGPQCGRLEILNLAYVHACCAYVTEDIKIPSLESEKSGCMWPEVSSVY